MLDATLAGSDGRVTTVEEHLAESHTDAFVVVHGGDVVAEWYAEPEVETTPQALMSITKSLIGCLSGILVNQELLDREDPVSRYLPEVMGGYSRATVQDLLDMRTGGDYAEVHDDPDSELGLIVRALLPTVPAPPTLHGLVLNTPRVAASRGSFSYRSLDTEVLGWVLERIAGRAMPQLLEDELLGLLGLETLGSMAVDTAFDAHHAGGLALTPRDLARVGLLMLHGGAVGDKQVVPIQFLRDTRSGGDDSHAAFVAGLDRAAALAPMAVSTIYRNQFWVPEQGGRQLLCIGIHGQLLYVDPDNDTVVVKLSSWPAPRDPHLFTLGFNCAVGAAEALGGYTSKRSTLIA
ncbi:serine hydrolase domain-containing protein [Marmoricola sp. URHA0025 HA25]